MALDRLLDVVGQSCPVHRLAPRLRATQDPFDGTALHLLILNRDWEPQLTGGERRHISERTALSQEVIDADLGTVGRRGQVHERHLGAHPPQRFA